MLASGNMFQVNVQVWRWTRTLFRRKNQRPTAAFETQQPNSTCCSKPLICGTFPLGAPTIPQQQQQKIEEETNKVEFFSRESRPPAERRRWVVIFWMTSFAAVKILPAFMGYEKTWKWETKTLKRMKCRLTDDNGIARRKCSEGEQCV